MKQLVKKELKRNFCLIIVIGIAVYLSKFAKKAVPVAAACSVVAMPLAGIGAVNIASAQEDNLGQYPVIDLPAVSKNVEDTYPLRAYLQFRIFNKDEYDRQKWQDILERKERWKKYDWLRKENVDISMVKIAENDISYYSTLAKILQKSSEEVNNPKSSYSPLYSNKRFNKYLDSIVSDAQRAGEAGVESLIPSPDGQVLDIISHGAYGQVSQINTIAQMSWYTQNISKTAIKMLEETRKSPEESTKVSESMRYGFDKRIDEVMSDFQAYYLINQGFEPIDTPVGLVKSFDEDVLEVQNSMKGYSSIWLRGPWGLYYGFSALGQKEITLWKSGVKNWVLDTYLDKYDYSLPEELDFVRVPITPEEKQDIIEIREIVDANKELVKTLPENKYSEELGETLEKANYWYNNIAFKPNTVIVSSTMGRKIKEYKPEEFKAYVDYFKEGAVDYPEILGKANNMKEAMDEDYGVLTKLVFKGDYERQKAELDKVKKTLDNFEPEEAKEIIVSVENDLGDVKENSGYKVLRFIELTPDHISNIRHTLFPTEEDKLERLKEKYGDDIDIGGKWKEKYYVQLGNYPENKIYQDFYGKEFHFDDSLPEHITIYGENGTIYCDKNDEINDCLIRRDPDIEGTEIPKIENEIIRK